MPEYVVLYHRGCNDGTTAAWCAKRVLGDRAIYLKYQYGEKVPPHVKGKHLILVDLSMPVEQLRKLRDDDVVKSIMIIDHHKSALPLTEEFQYCSTFEQYLKYCSNTKGFIGQFITMNRCGAVLSHLFFTNYDNADLTPEGPSKDLLPELLRYIEDYDLWVHQYTITEPLNRWMIDGGVTIEDLETLHTLDGKFVGLNNALMIGEAYSKYNQDIVKSVTRGYIQEIDYLGHKAALVNGPHHLRNNVGDALVEDYLFVACYTERANRTVFSLRAKKGRFDVSALCERYDGGGHADAAAFSVPVGTNPRLVVRPTFWQKVKYHWNKLTGKGDGV